MDRKLQFFTSSFFLVSNEYFLSGSLLAARPSDALRNSRKSLSLHILELFEEDDESFELLMFCGTLCSLPNVTSETLNGDKDLVTFREVAAVDVAEDDDDDDPVFRSLPRWYWGSVPASFRVRSIAAANGSVSFLCRGENIFFGDLGDFGDEIALLKFSSGLLLSCNRGGGLRGRILPPSKSSSAEREVLSSWPLKSNAKS